MVEEEADFLVARSEVPICVWQSRYCRFKTANALVVFHVPARHQDPGRRSGFLVAAKRCHYRYLRSLRRATLDGRERASERKVAPTESALAHNAGCRYCPATNVLIKFIGRSECTVNVNGFRGTGGLAVGSKRQQMSHSRRLSMATPSTL